MENSGRLRFQQWKNYYRRNVPGSQADGVMESNEFTILILAAGSSSRMGQSKQKLQIHEKPLLVHTTETALAAAASRVVVVLGSEENAHRSLLEKFPVEIVVSQHWERGMGYSLKAGLSFIISRYPQTEAVIILVCDQPLLNVDHINSLIKKYTITQASVVASAYSNTRGVPALFTKTLFPELLALSDDQGAKKIIQQHISEAVDFPEGAVDLDTPEDYRSFLQQHSKKMP